MKITEGHVYLCKWRESRGKFVISLTNRPDIRVSGRDREEAEELLYDKICTTFGDGEAVLEYVTPLLKDEFQKQYGNPDIVMVSGNGSVGEITNGASIWRDRACDICGRQRRQRSEEIAEVDYLPNSDGTVDVRGRIGNLFSESFLSLLTARERDGLTFLPVRGPKKSRKKFFELTGMPLVRQVGHPGFPGQVSRKCDMCGMNSFTYLHNNDIYTFIAHKDLPDPIPPVFGVLYEDDRVNLCMTRERYKTIIGKKGTRDIVGIQLWVIKGDGFIRDNDDENYPEELYWKPRNIMLTF